MESVLNKLMNSETLQKFAQESGRQLMAIDGPALDRQQELEHKSVQDLFATK